MNIVCHHIKRPLLFGKTAVKGKKNIVCHLIPMPYIICMGNKWKKNTFFAQMQLYTIGINIVAAKKNVVSNFDIYLYI